MPGVRIDEGPQPFQIIQQDGGYGTLRLQGSWPTSQARGTVQVRVVREDDGIAVRNWENAGEQHGSLWSHSSKRIPAGALYRVESRLGLDEAPAGRGLHGSVIHHLGVGDLWIIAGQSNAAGYGRGPVDDPPQLGIHILKNDERWDIAAHPLNDPTGSTHPNREIATPGHSPYLAFAKHLHRELGYPIGLVQTALGNSALSQWNPLENPAAPLYHNLLHCVRLAGGRVRGTLWYQGESDTNPGQAESYETRFAAFLARLRSDLAAPELPVILAQLNRYTGRQSQDEHRGWSIVREAQRNARKLTNVAVVPTIDLPLCDDCHTSPEGNLLLGMRKARAALAMVYRKDPPPSFPDVIEAVRGLDGRTIELTFGGVAGRLVWIAPGERDFVVEEGEGKVAVRKAECVARDRVRLTLERPVSVAARVHGAFGADPPANLRDAEQNVPILGFYGLPLGG